MVLIKVNVLGEEKDMYIDSGLNTKIDNIAIPDVRKKDNDSVWIVDGAEGSGKSTFAMQLAKKFDPDFSLNRVCMTPYEFQKEVIKAKKFQCVVYDEAFTGLSARSALSEVNRLLVSLMMEMRQKNLFVIIVMPTFFMLDKYVALFRARGLFHVYKKRGKRGFWTYFNERKKKILYLNGKKLLEYDGKNIPRSNMRGRFVDFYTVDEEEYRIKKNDSLTKKSRITKAETLKRQRDLLLWYLNKDMGFSISHIARVGKEIKLNLERKTINDVVLNLQRDYDEEKNLKEEIAKELAEEERQSKEMAVKTP